jgi:hypothetical protein
MVTVALTSTLTMMFLFHINGLGSLLLATARLLHIPPPLIDMEAPQSTRTTLLLGFRKAKIV